jgi:hypothetical protein
VTERAASGRQLTPSSLRVLRGVQRLNQNDTTAGPLAGPAALPVPDRLLHTTTPRKGVTSL